MARQGFLTRHVLTAAGALVRSLLFSVMRSYMASVRRLANGWPVRRGNLGD